MAKKGIYIERTDVADRIRNICEDEWGESIEVSDLYEVGNTNRCDIVIDGKKACLNFYFRNDGSTTIQVTGTNTEISSFVKESLETNAVYKASIDNRTSTFKGLSEKYIDELIQYLNNNEKITYNEVELEDMSTHYKYVFKSTYGDKMVLNRYGNGTVLLQGKPAYIYCETLGFLSYAETVSKEDLINSVTTLNSVNVATEDVTDDVKCLLGSTYGSVDSTVKKILSPAIALRHVNIELEDYSCFAFPALRALEGQIKWLLLHKNVSLGDNFGTVFNGTVLNPPTKRIINDELYSQKVQELYVYYKNTRNRYFHVDNVLCGSSLIERREEADLIIQEVIDFIVASTNLAAN